MFAALAVSLALAQAPSDFQRTFEPAAVGSYLEGRDALIVVAAGAPTPARAAAADALEAAVRASGKAQLVLDGKSVGDVSALDDPSVVQRCAGLPVHYVLLVRAFESAGQPARAVATLYDLRGALVTAFAAVAGTPLAPAGARPSAPGAGLDPATARAVLQTQPEPAALAAAQQQYDESYIGFTQNWFGPADPTVGKFSRELGYVEFFNLVGRSDLVSAYKGRRVLRTALYVAGAAIAIGAPIYAFAVIGRSTVDDCDKYGRGTSAYSRCFSNSVDADITNGGKAMAVAGIGFVAGAALFLTPMFLISPSPIDEGEIYQLANTYNDKLKARLGLGPAPARAAAACDEAGVQVSLGTFKVPGGGGLLLDARF